MFLIYTKITMTQVMKIKKSYCNSYIKWIL